MQAVLYGYVATMKTRPGRRDDVVAILLRDVDDLRQAGCHSYIVSVADADADTIHVTEVWESSEHHQASLQLPAVRATIDEAMPLLTGEFTGQERDVLGGLGLES